MKTITFGSLALAIALLAMAGFATPAAGETIPFYPITSNAPEEELNLVNLFVDVSTATGPRAVFNFRNESNDISSMIASIYFLNMFRDINGVKTGLLSKGLIDNSHELVSFHIGTKAGAVVLPGGKTLDPDFTATDIFNADPGNYSKIEEGKGIDPGEWIKISFALNTDVLGTAYNLDFFSFEKALLGVIDDGLLRIGLHVRRIGENDKSDSFVLMTDPAYLDKISVVPEPATMTLLGLGIAGIAFRARRRRA